MVLLRTPWYERRFIGRTIGTTSVVLGVISALCSFHGAVQKPQKFVALFGGVGMCICDLFLIFRFASHLLGAQIFGFWMLMKRYWNDPSERLEEHWKFLQGSFMEYYNANGWEHMLEGTVCLISVIARFQLRRFTLLFIRSFLILFHLYFLYLFYFFLILYSFF
jgi:hypothetical protein